MDIKRKHPYWWIALWHACGFLWFSSCLLRMWHTLDVVQIWLTDLQSGKRLHQFLKRLDSSQRIQWCHTNSLSTLTFWGASLSQAANLRLDILWFPMFSNQKLLSYCSYGLNRHDLFFGMSLAAAGWPELCFHQCLDLDTNCWPFCLFLSNISTAQEPIGNRCGIQLVRKSIDVRSNCFELHLIWVTN